MKNILFVDDEKPFLLSLVDGLESYSSEFSILTGENGYEAIEILKSESIDLLITDLNMPKMDGFQLLAYMSKNHPNVPTMVMTAFGTPEINKSLESMGVSQVIEKPLDLNKLIELVFKELAAGTDGYLHGITLPTFLQLVEMDRKTCTLKIKSEEKTGHLYFNKGEMIDAETGTTSGTEAALELLSWSSVEIEIDPVCRKQKKNIELPLNHLLLEALRISDETGIDIETEIDISTSENNTGTYNDQTLHGLRAIQDFVAAAIYSSNGEAILVAEGDVKNFNEIGMLANELLVNAQKASLEMETGKCQMVHITDEKAQIIVYCLSEKCDPGQTKGVKTGDYLVLVLGSDAGIGMAKRKIESIAKRFTGKESEDKNV